MKVADVMKCPIPTLSPLMTWKQAAAFFLEHHLSAAPVVDEQETLVGVLSEKDLFHGLFPSYGDWLAHPESYVDFEKAEVDRITETAKRTVQEIMSKTLISTSPETPILKIGALMVARNVHQVPVVKDGRVIGMVQRGKIYMEILRKYFNIDRP
ncbi:MAG: CBS domain-containing protein [Patescibacteria group bacterium]